MECNKDEASKAKVIAEQMLTKNDFVAAKKFALKAQALYPRTEGISQLMMTINVYVSAAKKASIGGEIDWYGVLGVTPTADDETIKKQYRKLALMIHPDKNKCVGADDAFKLVLEAWSLLSDKAERYAYDQRRICFLNNNGNVSTNNNNNNNNNWPPSSSWWNARPPPPNTNTNTNTNTSSFSMPPPPNIDSILIMRWSLAERLKNEWEKAIEEEEKAASVSGKKRKANNKERKDILIFGPPPGYVNPVLWFWNGLTYFPPDFAARFRREEKMKQAREEEDQAVSGTKKKKQKKKRGHFSPLYIP